MNSLLIAPTIPSDSNNGLAMRIGMFLEALHQLGKVELLVLPVSGGDPATTALCERLAIRPTTIEL